MTDVGCHVDLERLGSLSDTSFEHCEVFRMVGAAKVIVFQNKFHAHEALTLGDNARSPEFRWVHPVMSLGGDSFKTTVLEDKISLFFESIL